MAEKYDGAEALRLMARGSHGSIPDRRTREHAAEEVLDALAKLDGEHGFRIQKAGGLVATILLPQYAFARRSSEHEVVLQFHEGRFKLFWVRGEAKDYDIVPLTFDRQAGAWVGPRVLRADGTVVRRTALGAIMALVLGLTDEA